MAWSAGTLISDRYRLVECVGSGAMGEVWKARDIRFEELYVAVKLLNEDESLEDDARHRAIFLRAIRSELEHGGALDAIVYTLVDVLRKSGIVPEVRRRAEEVLGSGPYTVEGAARVFDTVVNDPQLSDSAWKRARLRKSFRDEANAVANLRHPNIVAVTDYGEHGGAPFLVMEFVEGVTLAGVIDRGEPMRRFDRLRLMEDLCAGLDYAHRRQLVHRDIKPANLIIDHADRTRRTLKILDFGVVRRLQHAERSMTGNMPVGTFCYMSPEQARGNTLDARSDIFAVGLVFYELLSGAKAFPPGDSVFALIRRIEQESPVPLQRLVPDLEDEIEAIVNRALQKDPTERYQTLREMGRDILSARLRLETTEESARTLVLGPDATMLLSPDLMAQVAESGEVLQETERLDLERVAAEQREFERREAERREVERREAERREAERREAEHLEAERREAERREAERREREQREREQREAERRHAEQIDARRREAERLEAERQAVVRQKVERENAERREAERRDAERRQAAQREEEARDAEERRQRALDAQHAEERLSAAREERTQERQRGRQHALRSAVAAGAGFGRRVEREVRAHSRPVGLALALVTLSSLGWLVFDRARMSDEVLPQPRPGLGDIRLPGAAGPNRGNPTATSAVTTVSIDAHPWARVTVVRRGSKEPVTTAETPAVLALPPGDYVVEFDNGGLTRPTSRTITVGSSPPAPLRVVMPGFDVDELLKTLVDQS